MTSVPSHIGPYRLEERIGAGGMGEVYRAIDERLERTVALKHMTATMAQDGLERKRVRREAQAAARLKHPAIVRIYDLIERDDGDWIVMELVTGQGLDAMLTSGPLALGAGLVLFQDLAEGLAEAHGQAILHRDLKAENVLVTPGGRGKLLDFGLARPLENHQDQSQLTLAGMILGTPHAMSPEQARSKDLDARSDLFSLGSLMFFSFTGQHPFRNKDWMSTLAAVCFTEPPNVQTVRPDLPPTLAGLIDRLLQKNPDHRPASGAEVAAELLRIRRLVKTAEVKPPAGPLGEDSASTAVPREPSGGAEKRRLTLVRCELTTPEGDVLDPERLLEQRAVLKGIAEKAVARFEGALLDVTDQGVLLSFGYPRAHEDEARRALRAAVEILDEMALDEGVAFKAALHTGAAIVTQVGSQTKVLLGKTATVVGEAVAAAPQGAIVLTSATRPLVGAFSKLEAMDAASPGQDASQSFFRWCGEQGAPPGDGQRPMIPRRRELELLEERWRRAGEGSGQAVLLVGEAGIGKSSLTLVFRERLADAGPRWLESRCSPYDRSTPFAPFVGLVRRAVTTSDDPLEFDQIESLLADHHMASRAAVTELASLLAVPFDGHRLEPETSPQLKRRRLIETIVGLLAAMACREPTVVVLEDLHWIDPSSLELLGSLLDALPATPMLLLVTTRPEFESPWERSYLSQLTLGRMRRDELVELVERLCGERPLAPEQIEIILDKADGIPLFATELAQTMLQAPWSKHAAEVPAGLHDFLAARLDQLGTAKTLAQQCAALDRSFSQELLAAVTPFKDRELKRLIESEILDRRGFGRRRRYTFRHSLIQDAAYQSLVTRERKALHRRVAEVLETEFSDSADGRPHLLARHHAAAGQAERAAQLYREAALIAAERCAHLEAADHLNQALGEVSQLPPGAERDTFEASLQILLAQSYTVTRGYASAEVEACLDRARHLTEGHGERSQEHCTVLIGLARLYLASSRLDESVDAGQLLLTVGRGQQDFQLEAHRVIGVAQMFRGELAAADQHNEQALALYEAGSTPALFGTDPAVSAQCQLAASDWFRGFANRAVERIGGALESARDHPQQLSLALALRYAAWVHELRREPKLTREYSEESLRLCSAYDFSVFTGMAKISLGWSLAAGGDKDRGLAEMEEGLEIARNNGTRLQIPFYRALAAYIKAEIAPSWLPRATEVVSDSIAASQHERWCLPELLRLRGLLAAQGSEPPAALDFLRSAVRAAETIGMPAYELRTTVSLLAHLGADRECEEMVRRLKRLLARWQEAEETQDLIEARAALALAPKPAL